MTENISKDQKDNTSTSNENSAKSDAKMKRPQMNPDVVAKLLHFSGILVGLFPGLNIILPIVLMYTTEDDFLRKNAVVVTNFQLSYTMYGLALTAAGALMAILTLGLSMIGFLALLVFAIYQMYKGFEAASRGEIYKYPYVVEFFS